jgi:hypothetical protein
VGCKNNKQQHSKKHSISSYSLLLFASAADSVIYLLFLDVVAKVLAKVPLVIVLELHLVNVLDLIFMREINLSFLDELCK